MCISQVETRLEPAQCGKGWHAVSIARSVTYSNFELMETFSERMSPTTACQINMQIDERAATLNSSNGYKQLHEHSSGSSHLPLRLACFHDRLLLFLATVRYTARNRNTSMSNSSEGF